ncbi:MAG TPA: GDP-mannose 4,6-dehydratase [bacterium]|nr:GDP-mannose 4,6-dehydratase [bacterium]HPQ66643.1 GDP-mannose 4,6-dehydratase [bacterium]
MSNSPWTGKNVFVTGCTGLLGAWLTEDLYRRGAAVTGLVRDWVPGSILNRDGWLRKINVVRGDVADYGVLERALNEYEIDTVFHLAAQTIVGTANRAPLGTFESNIKGTWNVLEACRRVPTVRGVVVASSDKAYGSHDRLPYDEEAPLRGEHPYDVSKSCADLLARSYYLTYGLPVAVTRCGNLFGGGDLNWNRIVPGTIRSVLLGEAPVIRSDGTFIRDYFYVRDAAAAYLLLAEKLPEDGVAGEAFNFSNEIQIPVAELVKTVLRLMDSPLQPVVLDRASGEIRHQYLSAAKARRVLGWKPLFSIEQGLGETIAWYREFFREEAAARAARGG